MKIIRKICFSLFLLVSLTYLFVVITPKIIRGFYPFGIKCAVVMTGSMEPTIEIDDFVIIKKSDKIKVNDIVAYKEKDNKYEILHRVVKIDGDEVTTKGDANNIEDQPISKSNIFGVYVGKIKYIGKIISFISKPIVFSVIITLLVICMFIPSKEE